MMRQKRNRIIYVPANDLKIHPTAQREISPTKLKKIEQNLDLDAIGTVHVVDYEINEEPGPWVVDGQHRVVALKQLGLGEWKVIAEVHECDDDKRASQLFLRFNDRAAVASYFKFMNSLQAEDEVATGVAALTEKHSLEISRTPGDGRVVATTALQQIYEKHGADILDETYETSISAWGRTPAAVEGKLLEGVAIVLKTYNGEIDKSALLKKLSKYPGGASGVLGDARGLRKVRGGSLPSNVAETIVETYNRGRRNRL